MIAEFQTETTKKTNSIPGLKTLSYSKLSNFADSPKELWKYINKERTQTESMIRGNLVDCLLFTPELFDEQFYIIKDIDVKTKTGEVAKNKKATGEWKEYEQNQKAIAGDRMVIDEAMKQDADIEVLAIKNDKVIKANGLLEGGEYQKSIEFEYLNWTFRGKLDIYHSDKIVDLKRVANTDPKKLKWTILEMLYHIQAAVYQRGTNQIGKDYWLICIDAELDICVYKFTQETLEQGRYLLDSLVKKLNIEISICEFYATMNGPDYAENFWKSFWKKGRSYHQNNGIFII